MRRVVIYHGGCYDGFCAAWLCHREFGAGAKYVPAVYGAPPPDVLGAIVVIVDFSYPRHVMLQLFKDAASVVVLDHHKTAEVALAGIVDEYRQMSGDRQKLLDVVFDLTKSGGHLAWDWHVPWSAAVRGLSNDGGAPWLVRYTEDRDLWKHELSDTREINAVLRSYPLDFGLWNGFGCTVPAGFVAEGAAIRRAEWQIIVNHVRHARTKAWVVPAACRACGGVGSFPVEKDKEYGRGALFFTAENVQRVRCEFCAGAGTVDLVYSVPYVNATVLHSEIAGELAKGSPFAAVYFDRADGKRQWSLRSDAGGLDVSLVAQARGGGGHAHAAGFEEVVYPVCG